MTETRRGGETAGPSQRAERSPKDTFITVYGRMPVLEVLRDERLDVDKVLIADNARGESLDRIVALARRRGVPLRTVPPHRVKLLAGNGKQDQGVLADVIAPRMRTLLEFTDRVPRGRCRVLVLDGVNNPANVGMIIRTATAAGLAGVVLPRAGSPDVDPLVIKASAGVAFQASIIRCRTGAEAAEELHRAGFRVYGLSGEAGTSLYAGEIEDRAAFVLGNETVGLSREAERWVDRWLSIPMAGGVDSLNVASAAAVVCFDLVRRAQSLSARRYAARAGRGLPEYHNGPKCCYSCRRPVWHAQRARRASGGPPPTWLAVRLAGLAGTIQHEFAARRGRRETGGGRRCCGCPAARTRLAGLFRSARSRQQRCQRQHCYNTGTGQAGAPRRKLCGGHISAETRVNERIRAPEVRLVGPKGEQIGIVSINEALRLAQEADLDLVEVAATARPPVAKLMDYGKFKYESAVKARESRKNQTQTIVKEIKLRPKIDPHDYGTKKGHVERFLKAGDKVKVTIMFRGREQSRPELGFRLLQKLAEDVQDLGFVESQAKQDGRNMIMVIGPHRKKAETRPAPAPGRPAPPSADQVSADQVPTPRSETAPAPTDA